MAAFSFLQAVTKATRKGRIRLHGQIAMEAPSFSTVVEAFSSQECARLEGFLASTADLREGERECIRAAAVRALHSEAHSALARVLVLELHAARLTGALPGDDPAAQFRDFLRRAAEPAFLAHLRNRYPALACLRTSLGGRRAAMETMISRMLADRERLARHFDMSCDSVIGLDLGLGDAHEGGSAVARFRFTGGSLMYKPRPMTLDVTLDRFLASLFPDTATRIRVPGALDRGDYGWAAFVAHAYCRSDDELAVFYRNLGRWIAVMHLLGGTDVHCDNLVAAGPVPVVVDPECLFARDDGLVRSPQGAAHAEAARLVAASVLRTSIVPHRLPHAAFEGLDISSMGATAEQRSSAMAPTLVDEGTVDARIAARPVELEAPLSMPSPESSFASYMEEVVDGFERATDQLRELDRRGQLHGLVGTFQDCRVRVMLRPTQLYAELRHMLWHPAALHTPEQARARAMEILGREVGGLSPTADQVARELADLEVRDIPVFRARVTPERIASVLERWRSDDLDMQQMILRGALLAADMNARGERGQGRRDRVPGRVAASLGDDREALRRQLLQRAVGRLARCTVRAADGSATWLGIALGSNGWAVEPVKSDFYGGLGGIAFALAAYRHEVAHARAEPVDGLQEALDGSLTTLRAMERVRRPPGNGGFNGLGAHIWQWLLLHSLLDRSELLGAAVRHAESLAGGDVPGNGEPDLLAGDAGLIVPLIHLAAATGQERWLDVASGLGRRLEDAAIVDDMGARWRSASFEDPIGGFAHGATGIGWALARLSISAAGSAGERQRWGELADGAFRFESSLYDEGREAWRDLRIRGDDVCSDAWCHGGIGIGLAASDLYARTGRHDHLRTMRLAVACALKHGWRRDVSLCHGSLGLRELLFRSIRLDGQPDAGVLDECDRVVLSEVARFLQGTDRMAAELFVPGLMTGMSGVVLGLCRMHPECRLPSPLLMEMEATTGTVASHPAAARNAPIAVA